MPPHQIDIISLAATTTRMIDFRLARGTHTHRDNGIRVGIQSDYILRFFQRFLGNKRAHNLPGAQQQQHCRGQWTRIRGEAA